MNNAWARAARSSSAVVVVSLGLFLALDARAGEWSMSSQVAAVHTADEATVVVNLPDYDRWEFWIDRAGSGNPALLARRIDLNGGGGNVITLSNPGFLAQRPQATVDATGAVIVAWIESQDRFALRYRRIGADGTVTSIRTASSGAIGANYFLRTSKSGHSVFVWDTAGTGAPYRIFARRTAQAGAIQPILQVSPDVTEPPLQQPFLALSETGDAVVGWRDARIDDHPKLHISYRLLPAAGGLGAVQDIGAVPANLLDPSAAYLSDGALVFAWTRRDVIDRFPLPTPSEAWFRFRSPNGAMTAPKVVFKPASFEGVRIRADGVGRAFLYQRSAHPDRTSAPFLLVDAAGTPLVRGDFGTAVNEEVVLDVQVDHDGNAAVLFQRESPNFRAYPVGRMRYASGKFSGYGVYPEAPNPHPTIDFGTFPGQSAAITWATTDADGGHPRVMSGYGPLVPDQ